MKVLWALDSLNRFPAQSLNDGFHYLFGRNLAFPASRTIRRLGLICYLLGPAFAKDAGHHRILATFLTLGLGLCASIWELEIRFGWPLEEEWIATDAERGLANFRIQDRTWIFNRWWWVVCAAIQPIYNFATLAFLCFWLSYLFGSCNLRPRAKGKVREWSESIAAYGKQVPVSVAD